MATWRPPGLFAIGSRRAVYVSASLMTQHVDACIRFLVGDDAEHHRGAPTGRSQIDFQDVVILAGHRSRGYFSAIPARASANREPWTAPRHAVDVETQTELVDGMLLSCLFIIGDLARGTQAVCGRSGAAVMPGLPLSDPGFSRPVRCALSVVRDAYREACVVYWCIADTQHGRRKCTQITSKCDAEGARVLAGVKTKETVRRRPSIRWDLAPAGEVAK